MSNTDTGGTVIIPTAEALDRLSNEPEIRKAVARRKASREKPQAEPPLLPEKWHSWTL